MKVIGLDIGTTTICAVVADCENGKIIQAVTYENDTKLDGEFDYERIQNPTDILEKCTEIVDELSASFSPVCIGITGQMHGILYLDNCGNAVSPLYFWQDESGNRPFNEHQSYAEYLTERTGHNMATGFGATTLFCHTYDGRLPEGASKVCTIHDYVAMKLCDNSEPLMHTSDAASLGLFDIDSLQFDKTAITKAGMDYSLFPKVTKDFSLVGKYKGQVPVSVAIGDNQASFLGSVSDMRNSILVNVGTGSQISFLTDKTQAVEGLEIRPCFDRQFLCVGSSLCGGRAFAVLEEFLRQTAALVTGEPLKSAYPAMDDFLNNNAQPANPLAISTRLSGTRSKPEERGSIENMGLNNFTPQHLIWGFLNGMVEELQAMYRSADDAPRSLLIGSGNGLRKNSALQQLFADKFELDLLIPTHSEEAAFGAALFALTAAGYKRSIFDAQKLIKYH
ncbi:MAG TPA: FGGY family carbohydrate kinase [Clostridia bacterium]|nr:FGGY family carbohydrate kinase [Clostridia bacterium]